MIVCVCGMAKPMLMLAIHLLIYSSAELANKPALTDNCPYKERKKNILSIVNK